MPRRPVQSMGRGLLLAAFLMGCGGAEPPATDRRAAEPLAGESTTPSDRSTAGPVLPGVDALLEDSVGLLRGLRAGLITNHTGVSARPGPDGEQVSTIDLLYQHPGVELVALFSPEHGLRGRAEAGEQVASGRDPATGLPIHSLYGEDRTPTPAMLEDLDVLLFDIQDIGTRYYTYVWTMALAMEAAGQAGVRFVVLDRPNPIGGRLVQGNVLDPEFATFVGLYPVPMRHGLTAGELARMLVGEFEVDVDLSVIPVRGWTRTTWYDATDLPWIAPSPNMPSLASATHYPGTCLFEGTNLSVGRGTDIAFQQIGAPWLDHQALASRLNDRGLPGLRVDAVTFTPASPGDGKFGGEEVRGIRFIATNRTVYDPTRAAVAALIEIHRLHPDRLEWRASHFDRLAGTDRLRADIIDGATLETATAGWEAQRSAFEAERAAYLLYR